MGTATAIPKPRSAARGGGASFSGCTSARPHAVSQRTRGQRRRAGAAGSCRAGWGAHEVGQRAQVRGVRVRDEHAVQRGQQGLQRAQQAGVVRVVPAAVQQQPEAVDLPAAALLRAARPA